MINTDCGYICAYDTEEFDCKQYSCDLYFDMMMRKEKRKRTESIDKAINEYENAIEYLRKLRED